jgi:hypothetical protein
MVLRKDANLPQRYAVSQPIRPRLENVICIFISPVRPTYLAYLPILRLIISVTAYEALLYVTYSSLLTLFHPYILLRTLFSNALLYVLHVG